MRATFKFGAQNRAFPAGPKELRNTLAVFVRRYFTCLLGGSQATSRPRFPVAKDTGKAVPERLWQNAHLLTQIADETSALVAVPGHPGVSVGDEVADTVQWSAVCVVEPVVELASEIAGIGVDQFETECVFAVKVMIK